MIMRGRAEGRRKRRTTDDNGGDDDDNGDDDDAKEWNEQEGVDDNKGIEYHDYNDDDKNNYHENWTTTIRIIASIIPATYMYTYHNELSRPTSKTNIPFVPRTVSIAVESSTHSVLLSSHGSR